MRSGSPYLDQPLTGVGFAHPKFRLAKIKSKDSRYTVSPKADVSLSKRSNAAYSGPTDNLNTSLESWKIVFCHTTRKKWQEFWKDRSDKEESRENRKMKPAVKSHFSMISDPYKIMWSVFNTQFFPRRNTNQQSFSFPKMSIWYLCDQFIPPLDRFESDTSAWGHSVVLESGSCPGFGDRWQSWNEFH